MLPLKHFIQTTLLAVLTTTHAQAITITMTAGLESFDGLLLEGTGTPNVGVIFFHGRGQHPNGDVVRQLRNDLNTSGYTTLSIENPVPTTGMTPFSDYAAEEDTIDNRVFDRLIASVNELVARNSSIDTIVLGGFSLGSRFATSSAAAWEQGFLTDLTPGVSLGGLIGAGMTTNLAGTTATITPPVTIDDINVYDTLSNLSLISSIPVLDIFGDLDSKAADIAAARMAAFGGDLLGYTQIALGCPDFNNTAYYARNSGTAAAYTENRCHQMRNGFLTEADALANDPDIILRGASDAPLESNVNAWMTSTVPLAAVPVPAAFWLFGAGLIGLTGFAKRK